MNFFLRITGTFSLIFVGCKRDHLYDHLPFILDWRPGLLPASWELWGMSFGLVPVAAPEIDVRCAQVMKEHSLPINISLSESVCLSFVIKLATVQGAWCGERAEWGMPHAVASFGCPCAAHKLVGEFFMLPQHDNVTRPPTYVLSLCHAPSQGHPGDVFAHFASTLARCPYPSPSPCLCLSPLPINENWCWRKIFHATLSSVLIRLRWGMKCVWGGGVGWSVRCVAHKPISSATPSHWAADGDWNWDST